MKNLFKTSIKIVAAVMTLTVFMSVPACNDDPDAYVTTEGKPKVDYIRIPDALSADSLVTHAFMGTTIALVGENLTSIKQLWFNDQKAILNTSLITSTALIVTVPNTIPQYITNKISLINASGDTVKYAFKVDVPSPLVESMNCEYVATGETAVINGNFFLPVEGSEYPEVYFTPNIKGTVVSFTLNQIKVKVPEGAGVGKISVKSRYGSTRSGFYFRDNRGMILDWDNTNAAGGWRAGVTDDVNPTGISGKYVRFTGTADPSGWTEDGLSFNLWGSANGRPEGDLFTTDPASSVMKFEVNVDKAWTGCALQMIFTPWGTSGTNGYIADGVTPRGLWSPWSETGSFITDGWITVSFPLTQFMYSHTGATLKMASPGNYGGLTFFLYNGGGVKCTPDICIDNIRVVPAE
jgi:hypothetical protein